MLLGERFDESSLNGYSQRRSEDESDGNRQYSNLPSNQTNQANLLSPPSSFSDGRVERQPQQSSNINRRTKRNVGVDEVCKAKNRSPLPKKLDWRAQGKVTSIKNQGSCGSCWTFTSLAALESAYLIKKNQKLDLSEQELLSCARKNGCKGGTAIDAYNYFLKRKGVTDEQTWPYAKKVIGNLFFLLSNLNELFRFLNTGNCLSTETVYEKIRSNQRLLSSWTICTC